MNSEQIFTGVTGPVTSGAPRWHGAVEGLHNGLLYGWAFDAERHNARVIIEILLDDIEYATAIADVGRTDLADTFRALHAGADACHGFVADLRMFDERLQGTLAVRIANTNVVLGQARVECLDKPPASATSKVIGDGGLRLHGWAFDPAAPQQVTTVRAFVGHQQVAECRANMVDPLLRAYVIGAHSFDLMLPAALADGYVHSVRVVDEQGQPLNGSPLTVCCLPNGLQGLLPEGNALLSRVADVYERHLPRSLDMRSYDDWSSRFDKLDTDLVKPRLKAGILITGALDAAAITRTAASLEHQGATLQGFAGEAFPVMLRQALDAGCDVIACVRAGDSLAPGALHYALEGFARPEVQVVYTDSIAQGKPWFKPAWNADYAFASDYPLDLLLVRSDLIRDLPASMDQASFAWSSIAAVADHGASAIVHVPRVLYQFGTAMTEAEIASRDAAAAEALRALEPSSSLVPLQSNAGFQHAARRLQPALPCAARDLKVSLVIPTRDHAGLLKRCIDTIRTHTAWPRLEIIVIDNGSVEEETHAYFAELEGEGIRILAMPGPFNYADLNNRAIAQATGEIVGLINNDIEALHDGWLDEIVAQLLRPGVGAVGAKLLWPNGMVQHGGILLGVGNVAGHFGNRLADGDWGDYGRNQLVQQVSGCTAACLFLRRKDYLDLGGMDAQAFPVAFNDVDLCLRLRAAGKAVVWTPFAKLLHAESASRGHEDTPQKKARAQREVNELRRRWGPILLRDPAYHPSLNLDPYSSAFGGLAFPPRPRNPRTGMLPTLLEVE
jgi:GT2 family glycosyltransferase